MRTLWSLIIVMTLLPAPATLAAEGCGGFKWDVTKEAALFDGARVSAAAGKTLAAAPTITTDRLFQLQLAPQADVAFVLSPGRKGMTGDAYGGLAVLKLDRPGHYRVAVDAPLWIDVVAAGQLTEATDFQGQATCTAMHKIVEFDLAVGHSFTLQLSGSKQAAVRLTVTAATSPRPAPGSQ